MSIVCLLLVTSRGMQLLVCLLPYLFLHFQSLHSCLCVLSDWIHSIHIFFLCVVLLPSLFILDTVILIPCVYTNSIHLPYVVSNRFMGITFSISIAFMFLPLSFFFLFAIQPTDIEVFLYISALFCE